MVIIEDGINNIRKGEKKTVQTAECSSMRWWCQVEKGVSDFVSLRRTVVLIEYHLFVFHKF